MCQKENGEGFASNEDSVDVSIQRLEDYIEKHGGKQIAATRNNCNDTRTNRTTITRKQKWEEKQLYGRFKRLTSDISHEKTWRWLRKGNLERETESLLIAAQINEIVIKSDQIIVFNQFPIDLHYDLRDYANTTGSFAILLCKSSR